MVPVLTNLGLKADFFVQAHRFGLSQLALCVGIYACMYNLAIFGNFQILDYILTKNSHFSDLKMAVAL